MCKFLQFRPLQPSTCHSLMSSPTRPLTDVETLFLNREVVVTCYSNLLNMVYGADLQKRYAHIHKQSGKKKNDCLRLPWIDPLLWINYAQWSNSTSRLRRGSALPLSGWRMWTSSGGRSLPWNWNPSGGWSALPLSWRILQHVDHDSRHSKLLPSTCWYNRMPRKVRMIRHD